MNLQTKLFLAIGLTAVSIYGIHYSQSKERSVQDLFSRLISLLTPSPPLTHRECDRRSSKTRSGTGPSESRSKAKTMSPHRTEVSAGASLRRGGHHDDL